MNVLQAHMFLICLLLSAPAVAGADPATGQTGDGGTVDAAASVQNPAADRKAGDVGAYSSILQRGLFGEAGGPSSAGSPAPPSSTYRLVGTLESGGFAGAVIDDGTGVQTFYRIGQKLPDESRITRVWRDRILVKRPDGSVAELFISGDGRSPAGPPVPGGATAVLPPVDGGASGDARVSGTRSHRRRSSRGEE